MPTVLDGAATSRCSEGWWPLPREGPRQALVPDDMQSAGDHIMEA